MSDQKDRAPIAFIVVVTTILIPLTNIPLVYGYLVQPAHLAFMGIVAGVRDSNVYFMMMTQGDGWSPIIENLFRPGEPNAIYHGFFWFLLGKLAYSLGLSNLTVYHLARAAATAAFVPAVYVFAGRFLESRAERMTAAVVMCFGAGAGWIMVLLHRLSGALPFVPADVGTPEASAFYTLMTFPHLSFTLIFLLLCMMFSWDAIESEKIKPALWAGVCGLIVGFIHAFNLVVICAALALFAAAALAIKRERSPMRAAAIVACFAVWPIAYYTYITLAMPGLLPVGAVRSPTPLSYLVGFGPLVAAGAVRLIFLARSRDLPRIDLFMLCWIIANSLLLYSYPILSQEARAVLGLQAPLAILAARAIFMDILPALGAEWEAPGPGRRRALAWVVVLSFVVVTFPTTIYNIVDRSLRLRDYPELFSLTVDEKDALEYLGREEGGAITLSGERAGSYVPRVARKRAWMGQYNYPSYDRRMANIEEFFTEATPDARRFEMLRENNIKYVFHGDQERTIGGFRPEEADYLRLVFENVSVSVYAAEIEAASEKQN